MKIKENQPKTKHRINFKKVPIIFNKTHIAEHKSKSNAENLKNSHTFIKPVLKVLNNSQSSEDSRKIFRFIDNTCGK